MTRSQAIILEGGRKLDQGETLEVALRLLERVGAPDPTSHLDDAEWLAELERRAGRAPSMTGSTWEDVKRAARAVVSKP